MKHQVVELHYEHPENWVKQYKKGMKSWAQQKSQKSLGILSYSRTNSKCLERHLHFC